MASTDQDFLRTFYQQLDPARPADPSSAIYVPLHSNIHLAPSDPVAELQTVIEWTANASCQLFSGFRGTGKSTELLRLQQRLRQSDEKNIVVICDMQDYLNLSTPVDVSDFLVAIAGAFGEALSDPAILGKAMTQEGYFSRLASFFSQTRIEVPEIDVSAEPLGVGASIKANLKADPTFRRRFQERMDGHIGALTRDVHAFFGECIRAIRARHGINARVVLIVDSIEQISGGAVNASDVTASVATLFHSHADKLKIPSLHIVYTVPPWLKIKAPATATLYSSYQQIPCVKVRDRHGEPFQPGLDALERLIAARGDWQRLLGSRESLDHLILASGGYIRDLFRLLQATLRLTRARGLPAPPDVQDLALHEIRNSYLPISHTDARWLSAIDRTHASELPDEADLPSLARYFNNLLVMTYRNGGEWFGIHPLIAAEVRSIMQRSREPAAP